MIFFFDYMRLLLILQLILYENITDMYKSDYNRDQHTSILMERCPDFNPLKYSRDVYSSHWGKEADCLHSILFEEENTPACIVGVRTAAALTTRPKAEYFNDINIAEADNLFFGLQLVTRFIYLC